MSEKHTLTVVVNVFDDKYCDVYFFTPEHKKWCANLMCSNTFTSFVKDSMYYPLFNTKHDNPEKELKSLVRIYLNAQFGRVHDMSIHSYFDFSQSYSLEPAFDIDDCMMDEVYVCDYRIGKLYNTTSSWYSKTPSLYRADELVYDDDCTFHLVQEDLDDVISTVRRCGDELETFAELSLYAVKDDREIEVCPFSVGNKDYFVQKAREHANDKNYLAHKTYVYEYKNGKTNKVYGCCKFNEASNVVALNLEKEDDCNKKDNSTQCCADKDKIDTIKERSDVYRADNFIFKVDNQIYLSKYCSEVSVLYQKIKTTVKAKFYYNNTTKDIIYSNTFDIGSKHSLYLTVFNKCLEKHEDFLYSASSILTEKSYRLNGKELDAPLECELIFVVDWENIQ